MRIVVLNMVTLDGVMQGPGRADEDTRGGFGYGGWAVPYTDSVMGEKLGAGMAKKNGALLFGRRTYEDLLTYWNSQPDSPFTPVLNSAKKFVASTKRHKPLDWPNSTLLHGDVIGAISELKAKKGGDLTIMGSGKLIKSLMATDLIDEYLLMIHPLVLGTGHRLFDKGTARSLQLAESITTTTGVLLATYRPIADKPKPPRS